MPFPHPSVYRVAATTLVPWRFAIRTARVRIEHDRFELSIGRVFRRTLVVTRTDSGVERLASRVWLGLRPMVGNLGWDWEELAVWTAPSAPCSEHIVLTTWEVADRRRTADGVWIAAVANEAIARLHA